jgi:hypothetical protein
MRLAREMRAPKYVGFLLIPTDLTLKTNVHVRISTRYFGPFNWANPRNTRIWQVHEIISSKKLSVYTYYYHCFKIQCSCDIMITGSRHLLSQTVTLWNKLQAMIAVLNTWKCNVLLLKTLQGKWSPSIRGAMSNLVTRGAVQVDIRIQSWSKRKRSLVVITSHMKFMSKREFVWINWISTDA